MEAHAGNFLIKQDKVELIEKINAVETRLTNRLCSSKTELIKWMTALWLSGLALIAGFNKFL